MKRGKLEKVAERLLGAPAHLVEQGVDFILHTKKEVAKKKPIKIAREYWKSIGPGLTTGAADDDPSGIATYSQTGAQFGSQLIWLSGITFPLMAVVQEMCARLGLVTGHGLAANIRRQYPRWVLYGMTSLLFIANTFNLGADLGAMAEGVQLLVPDMSFSLLVVFFGLTIVALQIFTSYAKYARLLKYLSFALLTYILAALLSNLAWGNVARDFFIPSLHFGKDQILLIAAILGTTISPYLFFWQTSQEVEERILHHKENEHKWKQEIHPKTISHMRKDVWSGMFFSNTVMFFIIAASAGTLFANGITHIETAADAASALRPFAGDGAFYLFAIGIIGTGMLAVPVLAGSTSYAVSEGFGFVEGMQKKIKDANAFYGIMIVSILIGISLNFIGLDPMKALLYSAIANSIVSPVALFFIVRMSGSKRIMGEHANSRVYSVVGWIIFGLMILAGCAAIIALFL